MVLPAPFGPRKPNTSPGVDLERQAVERAIGALAPEANRVVLRELVRSRRLSRTGRDAISACASSYAIA